jgi:hypothetical protein
MANMQNSGMGKITYGELHYYFPLIIEDKRGFDDICKDINDVSVIWSEEYDDQVNKIFLGKCEAVKKAIERDIGESIDEKYMQIKIDRGDYENLHIDPTEAEQKMAELMGLTIFFSESDSLQIKMVNNLTEQANFRRMLMCQKYEVSKEIYGDVYCDFHERYFLLPVKIYLDNDEEIWVIPELIVFSNLMGFIKVPVPLPKIDKKKFIENRSDEYVSKATLLKVDGVEEFSGIDKTILYFLKLLNLETSANMRQLSNSFKHIILIDYEGAPSRMDKVSNDIKKEIFMILCAPVPEHEGLSRRKEISDFVSNQCYSTPIVNYYLKTNGGCLSLLSKSALDGIMKNMKGTEIYCDDLRYSKIASEIDLNAEFAIMLNILDAENSNNYFRKRVINGEGMAHDKILYNENVIFMNELVEYCYGSVFEQVEAFRNKMPIYHKTSIREKKSKAIDAIIKEKEYIEKDKFQRNISVFSVAFVVIFGLPVINDSLELLSDALNVSNIPNFSTSVCSLIIWVSVIIFVTVRLMRK